MLMNAEEARAVTNRINNECVEALLELAIKEAIEKGHYHCYVTLGDLYTLIVATNILKEKGYTYEYSSSSLTIEIKW